MLTRKFLSMCLVLVAVSLTACSEAEQVDPYALVTLHQATDGMVVSKGFKYKFQNPEIVGLHRNLGLLREGGKLEFIAARSLEDKMQGLTDGFFEISVIKQYSPFIHFKVEKVATETDTAFFPQAGSIAYPRIVNASEYGTDNYETQDINKIPYNNTGVLKELQDKKVIISARITIVEEEGATFYMLEGENAKLRVVDPSNGTGLILKILAENNFLFEGGVVMTEVEPFGSRRKSKVAGTVEIQFVTYANRIITG